MRRTQSLVPTLATRPADARARSHELLLRAGCIRQLGAGLYTLLPLGLAALRRIEAIVRDEMAAAGAQELRLTALHPAALWRESGRWDAMGAGLFKLRDRGGAEYCLAATHEEAITALARDALRSHRDVPQCWYQIQTKFRDEERPRAGLLRCREFTMKDAYSFDLERAGLDRAFAVQRAAYERIFARCGAAALAIDADTGAMGGLASTEFTVETEAGEDEFVRCGACGYAANVEVAHAGAAQGASAGAASASARCPRCQGMVERARGLELGHIFKLGTRYSAALGARVLDAAGQWRELQMGCYGIGLERLLAAVVETHNDARGICWPAAVSPCDVVLASLAAGDAAVVSAADALYEQLRAAGLAVLYDDRDESAGRKLADADLLGAPLRVVVSRRSLADGQVEWQARTGDAGAQRVALADAGTTLRRAAGR